MRWFVLSSIVRSPSVPTPRSPFQISQMQLEIQGIPKSLKSKYTPRLRSSQAELSRWKKISRETRENAERGAVCAKRGWSDEWWAVWDSWWQDEVISRSWSARGWHKVGAFNRYESSLLLFFFHRSVCRLLSVHFLPLRSDSRKITTGFPRVRRTLKDMSYFLS